MKYIFFFFKKRDLWYFENGDQWWWHDLAFESIQRNFARNMIITFNLKLWRSLSVYEQFLGLTGNKCWQGVNWKQQSRRQPPPPLNQEAPKGIPLSWLWISEICNKTKRDPKTPFGATINAKKCLTLLLCTNMSIHKIGHIQKHRKNCECCPVSLLIVRKQRMSLIHALDCQNSNRCLNCQNYLT